MNRIIATNFPCRRKTRMSRLSFLFFFKLKLIFNLIFSLYFWDNSPNENNLIKCFEFLSSFPPRCDVTTYQTLEQSDLEANYLPGHLTPPIFIIVLPYFHHCCWIHCHFCLLLTAVVVNILLLFHRLVIVVKFWYCCM